MVAPVSSVGPLTAPQCTNQRVRWARDHDQQADGDDDRPQSLQCDCPASSSVNRTPAPARVVA